MIASIVRIIWFNLTFHLFLVKLDCQGKQLSLKGQAIKLFKGKVQSKKDKKTICERNITESYTFEADFLFDECGIQKQAIL